MEREMSGPGKNEREGVDRSNSISAINTFLEEMVWRGSTVIKQAIQALCNRLHDDKLLVISVRLSDYSTECLGSDWGREYLGSNPEITQKFQEFCKDKYIKLEMAEQQSPDDGAVDDTDTCISEAADDKQELSVPMETVNELKQGTIKSTAAATDVTIKASDFTNVSRSTRPRRKSALKFLASFKKQELNETPVSEKLKTRKKVNKQKSEEFVRVKNPLGHEESTNKLKQSMADTSKKSNIAGVNDNNKDSECDICERTFRNMYALISHRRTHKVKSKGIGSVKSSRNFDKQKSEDSLRSSSPDSNESENETKATAPKACKKKKLLKNDNSKECECEICGTKFRNMHALISHSKVHKIKLEDRVKNKSEHAIDIKRESNEVELKEEGQIHPMAMTSIMKRVYEQGVNMYRCVLCDEAFRRRDKFVRHVRKSHSDKVGFQCQICWKSFREKCHLVRHGSTHTANHACDKCGKSYTTQLKLRHHLRIHTMDSFCCDQCGKAYKVKHLLARHIETVHQGIRFSCPDCSKSFTRLPALKEHQQRKHSGSDRQMIECMMCDKKYSSHGNLRIHVNTIHKQQFRHICDICGLKFPNKTRMRIHYHLHTGELPYKCEHCSKAYRRKDSLVLHRKLHSDQTFCMCDICGKSFTQKANLNHHRRFHNSDYKPYSCTYCSERFRTGTAFRTHILRSHKVEDLASEKSIILKCKFCPKLFSHREHLRAHENVHEGLKPYKCSLCQKAFSDRSNLRQHMTVHTKQAQKFTCEICSRGFSSDLVLKNHTIRCRTESKPVVEETQAGSNEMDAELKETIVDSTVTISNSPEISTTATLVPVSVANIDPATSVNMEQMTVYFDESSAVVALVTMDDTQDTENATKQLEELLLSVQSDPAQQYQ